MSPITALEHRDIAAKLFCMGRREKHHSADAARKMVVADLADQNLKKHIAAIHINNRLTLTQRKASNVLLHNAYEDLLTARVHRIRVKDLAEAIGFNTHNLDPLKEALKTLARTVLEWNILDEDGAQEEWGATTLLAQAVIKNGYCVYAYSPELCEKLYRPEIYALLNLSIQRKFSSGYALALYENCLRYRRVGTTGWIGLDNLKRLLGISETDGYYQDFRKFNDKIIKPAVRQVNETSDLILDVDYQRDHRKIAAVRFRVGDNPQMLLFAQRQAAMAMVGETPPASDNTEERHGRLCEKLAAFGLSVRQIRRVLVMHDPDYLEDNIAVVERDLVAGKVQNLPAYLLVALRKDYRPAAVRIRTASADSAGSPELIESHESPGISLDRLRTQLLTMRLQAALDRLDPAERTALERDYIVRLEQGNGFEARLILGLYRKSGLNSKIVESHFRVFARERLVGILDDAEIAAYAALHGHSGHEQSAAK
ncbi:replication initiation protein [Candidatus Contendibacter odensensis]|uniref:Plasmid replication initiation protein n=1 Tax=Candidatus Contendobacter odensis Run_B_J11 TaxID=1400861 RepID=A0A7U7GCZ2_9GAMM|nr:replication initiation protein [Candidatus Contendobacter odensis]CDH45922.1 putative Plasmid replication initiation protein [Candidatus Contendobacter odensis Run_B_J11]